MWRGVCPAVCPDCLSCCLSSCLSWLSVLTVWKTTPAPTKELPSVCVVVVPVVMVTVSLRPHSDRVRQVQFTDGDDVMMSLRVKTSRCHVQDVCWVRISITTHYNSIHVILNCQQVQIDRRTPGKHVGNTQTSSSWCHRDVIVTSSYPHASLGSVTTTALGKQLRSQTTIRCSQSNFIAQQKTNHG